MCARGTCSGRSGGSGAFPRALESAPYLYWVLLVDPGTIRLSDVYRMFVFGGAGGVPPGEPAVAGSPLALDTADLTRRVETAVEQGLDQTLAEHFGHLTR